MRRRYLFVVATVVLVSPAGAKSITASYRCADGSRWAATFHNPAQGLGSVALDNKKNGKTLILKQRPSADGGRYASGSKQLWVKGNQASFTRGGKDTTCRAK